MMHLERSNRQTHKLFTRTPKRVLIGLPTVLLSWANTKDKDLSEVNLENKT
jgi:hypothetical protein